MKLIIVFLFVLFFTINCIYAQNDNDYVISNPKKSEFVRISNLDSILKKNPDYTAYFLNATAYTLKKKQIRVSGTDILFIKGSYGITDNTTVSVNMGLTGTLTGALKQQINLNENIKVGISVSGGTLLFNPGSPTINNDRDSNIFILGGQAMVTLGNKQDNLTAGSGYYLLKGTFDFLGNGKTDYDINFVYVGFQKKISRTFYIMGEGMYFLNSYIITGAIGIKAIIGNRISLNFGIMPLGFNNLTTNKVEIPMLLPLISFRMLLGRN